MPASSDSLANIRGPLAKLIAEQAGPEIKRLSADGLVAQPSRWPRRLSRAPLLFAALELRGVQPLRLGDKAIAYVDLRSGTVDVIIEGPEVVQLRDVASMIEEPGAEMVNVNKADVAQTPEGYACNIGGHHATGSTIAKAGIGSWLIDHRAAHQGDEAFSALEGVDLTLAKEVINDSAQQDGDLGAEYWSTVLRQLPAAAQMRDALAVMRTELQDVHGSND